jgi:hypothetical protein
MVCETKRKEGFVMLRSVDNDTGDLHMIVIWQLDNVSIDSVALDGVPVGDDRFINLVDCQIFNCGISNSKRAPEWIKKNNIDKVVHNQVLDAASVYIVIKYNPDVFSSVPVVSAIINEIGVI